MYRQEPPFSIQVESTEGCNLRCSFCGLNGIRPKHNVRTDDRYMTPETAQRIAEQVAVAGWNPRIEFAMHGEPTLNPELHKLIGRFRRVLPDAYILLTTNGDPLRTHPMGFNAVVDRLFGFGVNTIALDNYRGMRVAPLFRAYMQERPGDLYEYPAQPEGNPHKRRPAYSRTVSIIADISVSTQGNHAHLSNHAGAAAPRNGDMAGKRCALPFRELSIRWDGNVALCCNDWRGVYKLGNVHDMTVEELWHSDAMYAARKYLLQGERTFFPCLGCDHRTYRTGLLPDKYGKQTYPLPTEEDDQAIVRALTGAPYTVPVRRPWEFHGRALPVLQPGEDNAQ